MKKNVAVPPLVSACQASVNHLDVFHLMGRFSHMKWGWSDRMHLLSEDNPPEDGDENEAVTLRDILSSLMSMEELTVGVEEDPSIF